MRSRPSNGSAIELGAPMLIVAPRRLRLLAGAALVALQLLIVLTGNYGFFNLIYLATGLSTFKPSSAAGHADGLLVVFTVDDIDAEYTRLQGDGVTIVTPIETEPWGERYFQMTDPNGVVYQLVQWVQPTDPQYATQA